jgi:putative endonuclease
MSSSRKRAENRGRRGETLAAWYLRAKGWRIVGRRVKTPLGEIDIVARRLGTVAFVEVKWRRNVIERDRAVDRYLLRRVAAAAEAVAHQFGRSGEDLRIDAILLTPWRWPRHLANIWQG